jgi:hypothetical protein
MTTLYNLRLIGPESYQITRFDAGHNVEARYVLNRDACECPAGTRSTCRHRKMLGIFLEAGHIADGWFLDWDTRLWWKPETGDIADARREIADEGLLGASVDENHSTTPQFPPKEARPPSPPSPPPVEATGPCSPPGGGVPSGAPRLPIESRAPRLGAPARQDPPSEFPRRRRIV